ncbi:MAG TPA: ABC transporter permease [Rectinema sp.]|nr:ABC transporter permease [Rectinema sp.]HQL85859.1 ABC transporter permease [Rectinema sp.]
MIRKIISGVLGVVIALAVGALIMLLQGYEPLATYGALAQFSIVGLGPFTTTLKNAVPLVLTGLSAAIAFASGPVNLGQPGQFAFGALAATLAGLYTNLPPFLEIPLLMLCAIAGGALWSGLAALLRQAFDMSEFIVTLMLNMIADFFTAWAIAYPFMDKKAFSPMTPPIAKSGWMPEIGPLSSSVIVMLVSVAIMWFVFQRWRAGYEWRITGQNSLFARIGGCDVRGNFVAVMLVTGALAGLAGGLVVMAGPHRFIKGLGANYAWDGIMVAIMANNGLVETLIYGIFVSAIQTGALGMELITNVPSEIAQVLQAVLVLVIVATREYAVLAFDKLAARRQAREHAA